MSGTPVTADCSIFHYFLTYPLAEPTRFSFEVSYIGSSDNPSQTWPSLSLNGTENFVDIVGNEFTIPKGVKTFSIQVRVNNDATIASDNKVNVKIKPLNNLALFVNKNTIDTSVEFTDAGVVSIATLSAAEPSSIDEGNSGLMKITIEPALIQSTVLKAFIPPTAVADAGNIKFSIDNVNWVNVPASGLFLVPTGATQFWLSVDALSDQLMLETDTFSLTIEETESVKKFAGFPLSKAFTIIDKTILPEGAFINWYCDGFKKMGRYSDGVGGFTTAVIVERSGECGYVAAPYGTILATYCANYNHYERVADGNDGFFIRLKTENVVECGYVAPIANTQTELTPTTLDKFGVAIVSNAGLGFASLKRDGARSKYGALFGKWYWEIEVSKPASSYQPVAVGLVTAAHEMLSWIGATNNSWGWWPFDGTKYHNDTQSLYSSNINDKDIISVLYDAEGKTLEFWVNGVTRGVAFNNLPDVKLYAAVNAKDDSYCLTNFGQYQFVYAPPTGYKPGFGVVTTPPQEKGSVIMTYCDGTTKKENIADGHYGFTVRIVKEQDPDCGYNPIPAAGTILGYVCQGFDQYKRVADGNGGETTVINSINSTSCGYVAPPVPTVIPDALSTTWKTPETTLSNNNTTAEIKGSTKAVKNVYSGKWYWEVVATSVDITVGITPAGHTTQQPALNADKILGDITDSGLAGYGFNLSTKKLSYKQNDFNGSFYPNVITTDINPGDIIGISLDLSNCVMKFSVNGMWIVESEIENIDISGSIVYYPVISSNTTNPATLPTATVHFGNNDLQYDSPAGFVPGFGTTTTVFARKNTVYTYFCQGTTYYVRLHDGNGGYYNQVSATNSPTCGWRPPDPAGTLKSTYCVGLDKWGRFADGNYGLYNELIQISHVDCGYRPAGSLISTRCQGFTQIGTYSDGLIPQGSYEQIIEENSRGCGYTEGGGNETPPGGVILDPNLPITYQTGIIISVTPIGLSSDPLIINVPLTP